VSPKRRLLPLSIDTRLTLWYAAAMLVILVLISGGSYSLLAWSMAQDVDRSLITVADVVRDTTHGPDTLEATERWLREVLDPDHRLFQLYGPDGDLRVKSSRLHAGLVLSPTARANIGQGRATFETVNLNGHWVRVVTVPVRRGERLVEVVQVGASLRPTAQTLQRWLETLLILVPLGVGLGRGRRLHHGARGAPAGGRDVARGAEDRRRGAGLAHRRAWHRRRAGPPGRDAERDAGAAREHLHGDAPLLGRRGPRAALAADRPEGHAGGHAAGRPHRRRSIVPRWSPPWRRSSD
jgi:hypothetical protein